MTITVAPELGTGTIKVYGQPGCSSCLRLKEFVEQSGRPFEYVNVPDDAEIRQVFKAKGIHPPAVSVGDDYIAGHNLDEVAAFLNVPYEVNEILPPDELKRRFNLINDSLVGSLRQMQATPSTWTFCLPNRSRDMLNCGAHASRVARTVPGVYYTDVHDLKLYEEGGNPETADDVVGYAIETRRRIDQWWEDDGQFDSFERVVKTYSGHHTLLEVWEREVWHTAQHTRQIQYALELQGIEPEGALTADVLEGLPIPERVHE